jgi:hypothetical protein
MAKKNRVTIQSNFRLAEKAAHEAVQMAVVHAVGEGEQTAADRLDQQASTRGYDLSGADMEKMVWPKGGKISYPHFYGRFFEYGTAYIPAMSFIRPGSRKMRKTFIADMGAGFEKWVSRRAGMRRR